LRKNNTPGFREINVSTNPLPIKVSDNLHSVFDKARREKTPVLAIVTGTKPDFYKQAPLVLEAVRQKQPPDTRRLDEKGKRANNKIRFVWKIL
jgi:hypothetical protein